MSTVLQVGRRLGADYTLTDEELRQIKAAVANQAYPARGRTGVGTTLRKAV